MRFLDVVRICHAAGIAYKRSLPFEVYHKDWDELSKEIQKDFALMIKKLVNLDLLEINLDDKIELDIYFALASMLKYKVNQKNGKIEDNN